MARKSRRKSGVGVWIGGVVICALAAVAAYYLLIGAVHRPRPSAKPSVPPPRVEVTEEPRVTLYLPRETDAGFVLVPKQRPCRAGADKIEESLRALLSTNKETGLVQSLIPDGTRLLGPVKVRDGVAEVNLSKELVDNFAGGSDQEALTLNAIVATAVKNSGGRAKRVRILVEGKSVESLGGHFDLSSPLAPDPQVVSQKEDK